MKNDAFVCRRSPHLVCYWLDSRFVVHDYANGVRVAAHPLASHVLGFFAHWRPMTDLLAASPPSTHAGLRASVRHLLRHGILERANWPRSARARAMDEWAPWNPAAGFFHATTKDVPFVDMETQTRTLRRKGRTTPMPKPVKRNETARAIRLPHGSTNDPFARVLLDRRTWRQFSRRPVGIEAFGALLGLTARVQRWAYVEGEGEVALKTSPSGSVRYSNDLYVLSLNVEGVARGLYHYASDVHSLELIRQGAKRDAIALYLPEQPWYAEAAAVVFFGAVFARELWRYVYARAYRAVLIEAGHLCQTFCLTATSLGLAPFCSMALADSAIEKDLKLDGISESVLYAAGVGTRPAGLTPPPARGPLPLSLTRQEVDRFPGRIRRARG